MNAVRRHRAAGLSLVELMLAMTLGLIVASGFISVFLATSGSQRTQHQLALLQESGRFAMDRLTQDLRMAHVSYCAQGDGKDGVLRRAPTVQANALLGALHDVTTRWGSAPYPAAPAKPYDFPPFLAMRGYDCAKVICRPAAPVGLPAMGHAPGQRVVGADVLTLRHLDTAAGWQLGSGAIAGNADRTIHHITIQPSEDEPSVADIHLPGDLLMLADCAQAQIFAANLQGGDTFYPDAIETGRNLAVPRLPPSFTALRLFDFSHDFRTVTYYLQVVDTGDGASTGALMRRENGLASEVVRGVERMDFRYGVEDADGATRYLAAAQVDDRAGGIVACPAELGDDHGCLWGAVKSIEVHLLLDGQQVHGGLAASALRYAYSMDGDIAPAAPDAASRVVRPAEQGFDNRMLRREFSTLVAVRNGNP